MMNWGWQGMAILSGVLSAVAQVIGKRQVAKMSAFQSGVLRDATVLAVMMGIVLTYGGMEWSKYSWVWMGVGLLESVMMAAYYSASRTELASTVIFSYPLSSVLIVGLAGGLFGEWQYFDPRTGVGMVNVVSLVAIIILMLIYQGGNLAKTKWSTKIVLSSLMVVASNVVIKWAVATLGVTPAGYMVWEYLGLVIGGVAYVGVRRQGMRVGASGVAWGALQGLLFAVSALMIAQVLRENPLSLASMMRRLATVTLTIATGLLWFKEGKKMNRRQGWVLLLALGIFGVLLGVNR